MLMKWACRQKVSTRQINFGHETEKKRLDRSIQPENRNWTTDPTSPRLPPTPRLRRTRRRTGGTDGHGCRKSYGNDFQTCSVYS